MSNLWLYPPQQRATRIAAMTCLILSSLSSSAHLQHQRTMAEERHLEWVTFDITKILGASALFEWISSFEGKQLPCHEATWEAAWEAGIARNQLETHVRGLTVLAKSLGDCPLLSCDWNLMGDLQRELNKSKIWIPDLLEHGWVRDHDRCWGYWDERSFATQENAVLYLSSRFSFLLWTSQVAHFDSCQFTCKMSSLSKYLIVHTNFQNDC